VLLKLLFFGLSAVICNIGHPLLHNLPSSFVLFSILVMRVDALHNCTQHHQQQQQGMMELHGV
jgi:hypothetical protein